jgi:hypothetical protein
MGFIAAAAAASMHRIVEILFLFLFVPYHCGSNCHPYNYQTTSSTDDKKKGGNGQQKKKAKHHHTHTHRETKAHLPRAMLVLHSVAKSFPILFVYFCGVPPVCVCSRFPSRTTPTVARRFVMRRGRLLRLFQRQGCRDDARAPFMLATHA